MVRQGGRQGGRHLCVANTAGMPLRMPPRPVEVIRGRCPHALLPSSPPYPHPLLPLQPHPCPHRERRPLHRSLCYSPLLRRAAGRGDGLHGSICLVERHGCVRGATVGKGGKGRAMPVFKGGSRLPACPFQMPCAPSCARRRGYTGGDAWILHGRCCVANASLPSHPLFLILTPLCPQG